MKKLDKSGRLQWAGPLALGKYVRIGRTGSAKLVLIGLLAFVAVGGLVVLILLPGMLEDSRTLGSSTLPATRDADASAAVETLEQNTSAVARRLPKDSPDAEPLPDEQEQALRKEQFEVANRLVLAHPSSASAAFVLGMTYVELGKTTEAVEHLQRCIRLNPRYAYAHDHLGRIAVIRGEHDKAVTLFRKALEIDPKAAEIHFHLARALALLGKFQEAIPPLRKEIQISPKTGANHHLLGEIYLQQQEYGKAIQSFETAIAVQPKLAWPYYGLATACERMGRRDEGKQYREKFKELTAKGQKAGRHWREVYDSMKDTRQSVAHSHTTAGRVYRAQKDDAIAERIWKRAAAIDPKSTVCRAELAALYQQKNRFSEALPLYKQLTEIQPGNGVNYLYLGQVNARLKRFQDAERAYQKVTQVAPKRPEGYRALAQLYLRIGRKIPEAKTLAARAVKLAPIAVNYFVLASACNKSGDRGGAVSAIRKAVRLDPLNAEYQQMYLLIQGGR